MAHGEIIPPCRKGAMCTKISSSEMVLFGGQVSMYNMRNDTFVLGYSDNQLTSWDYLEIDAPEYRWKGTLTDVPSYGKGIAFLFGGSSGYAETEQFYEDLWMFSNRTWMKVSNTIGNVAPRRAHIAVVMESSIIIQGGKSHKGNVLEDTWAIDLEKGFSFRPLAPLPGKLLDIYMKLFLILVKAIARKGHTGVFFDGTIFGSLKKKWSKTWGDRFGTRCMIVFGGRRNSKEYLNDVWALSFDGPRATNEKWILLDKGGDPFDSNGKSVRPHARNHHTAVQFETTMLVYGGRGDHSDESTTFDALWIFDLVKLKWTRMTALNQGPSPRIEHCALIFSKHMVVTGGQDAEGKRLNDVWSFSLVSGKNIFTCVFGWLLMVYRSLETRATK